MVLDLKFLYISCFYCITDLISGVNQSLRNRCMDRTFDLIGHQLSWILQNSWKNKENFWSQFPHSFHRALKRSDNKILSINDFYSSSMHWWEWSLNLWLIVLVSMQNEMNAIPPKFIPSILFDRIWSLRVAVFSVTLAGTVMCWSKEELNIASTKAHSPISGDSILLFISPPMKFV